MGWKGTVQSICAASGRLHTRYFRWSGRDIPPSAPMPLDWEGLLTKRPPPKPIKRQSETVSAEAALQDYSPSFLGTLTGQAQADIQHLQQAVAQAKARDDARFRARLTTYLGAIREWGQDRDLAWGVLNGQEAALQEVGREVQAHLSDAFVGADLQLSASEGKIQLRANVPSPEMVMAIFSSVLSWAQTPELNKQHSKNGLYRHYVENIARRLADAVLCVLPVSEVYVTCCSKVCDPVSGDWVVLPVLSAKVTRHDCKNGSAFASIATCWLFDPAISNQI